MVVEGEEAIEAINEIYKAVFDERTAVNRDRDRAKNVLESMGVVEEVEAVSAAELVAEKERLEAENDKVDEAQQVVDEQRSFVQDVKANIARIEEEIKILQEQLKEEKQSLKDETANLTAMEEEFATLEKHNLAEINDKIATVDETNKKAQKWQDYQKAKQAAEEYEEESRGLTAKLEAIKQYRQDLVQNAKFPVEGLDFAADGVLYKGLPFEQASEAEKLMVSFAIAAEQHPDLKVVTIDGAERLDSEYLALIHKMAEEKDLQVWMTIVDNSGKVGIVIEDGEVKE